MDEGFEDDDKDFKAEGLLDGDNEPDPEETLMLEQGGGKVWMIKVASVTIVPETSLTVRL
jgi:transcription initiation factor TFIIF subunit beta